MRLNRLHATERQHLLPLEVCKARLERIERFVLALKRSVAVPCCAQESTKLEKGSQSQVPCLSEAVIEKFSFITFLKNKLFSQLT